ncbi:MAG: von Willebrand factor type A domain-containing protein, partial [bacterium]
MDYDATPSDTPPIREWNNSFRREDVAKAKVQLKDGTDKLAKESGRADELIVEEPSMDEPAPILGNIPITGRLFSHGGMNARQPEKQIEAVSTAEASKLNVTVTAGPRSSPLQDADEATLEGGAMRRRVTEDSGSRSSPLQPSGAQTPVLQTWNIHEHDYELADAKEEKAREKTPPAAGAPVRLMLAQRDLEKNLGDRNRVAGVLTSGGGVGLPTVDYRIKSGETLSGIAKHYGVSMKDLAELNGLQNADSIKAGATILVPVTTPGGEQATQLQTAEKEPKGPVFKAVGLNPFVNVNENAFSTFSMDVDTASYTLARNYMLKGFLPPAESVRTEDFINFFDYAYKPPTDKLFAIYTDCAPTPFQRGLHLLKIGVEGKRLAHDEKRHAVLTFVIDTSGSMSEPDRLGLIQKSLRLLIDQLDPADSVAIVQYDSHARLVLDRTMIKDKKAILAALDSLQTSGSTNLEEGMREAYKLAARRFVPGAANRILLLSDGAANIGSTSAADILAQVESSRKQGIYCSVFGFGIGTYNDDMLKTLASKGDGTYAFIDSMDEAKRVFVEQLAGTLNVIAADAKIQIEFNPDRVKRYRQIGYEERQLKKEQF